MDTPAPGRIKDRQTALRAEFRMGFFLILLLAIHLLEAWITFPFVGHQDNVQNLTYGLLVTAPFALTVIAYLVLTRGDLRALGKRHPQGSPSDRNPPAA